MLTHGKPTYMPSVTIQHSANLPIYRVSPCDTRQTCLYVECHLATLGNSCYMPSVTIWHSANQFFFWFCPPNFLYCCITIPVALCWSFVYFWVILLYFINLFQLNEFSVIFWIWTASASNIRKKWIKNDILVTESDVRPYPGPDQKFRTSCSRNITTNVWRKRLKNL